MSIQVILSIAELNSLERVWYALETTDQILYLRLLVQCLQDLRLVELAVRAGADVFARDRNGKAVCDSAGKDDRVKAFLRQCEWLALPIFSGRLPLS